jgi:hypothetical protein
MNTTAFDPFAEFPGRQLDVLLDSDRLGIVDGVEFDFRHPSIPPALWHAPYGALGIELHLPSEWSEEDEAEAAEQFAQDPDRVPWVRAKHGDQVYIRNLGRFDRSEGPLVDEHDTLEWWAHLQLKRSTGEIININGVIMFVPRDALGPHSPHTHVHLDEGYADYIEQHQITFKKIGRRIERLSVGAKQRNHAMWAIVNGARYRVSPELVHLLPEGAVIELGWVYEAPAGAASEWLKLADAAFGVASEEVLAVEGESSASLEVLIDTVAAAAYALARAEAELNVAPLAKRALRVIDGGGKGGRKRAQNRQRWIAENWEPHATELAQQKRKEFPHKSQSDLAVEISHAWKREGEAPGHDWLLDFVRREERAGRLPRRIRRSVASRG